MTAAPGGVEVGRLSVRVVPDTSKLGPDLKVALDRIEAQTDLTISTSIDTSELDAQARAAVEQAQLAAGDIDIKANVDTSQVGEAERALGGAEGAARSLSLGLGGVATAAIVLGPALIPLVAVVIALGAALVAPLAIAAGGLTVFGFLAGFAVKETTTQLKNIDKLSTKLAGLKKGTAEYAATAAELQTAQAALTPAQAAFGAALDELKGAFDRIPKAIILGPITAGLGLLARILPLLTPVIKAVSGVLSDLLGQLDKAASSAGFKAFVAAFATQLGPDLRAFATIAGNVFQGLFGLFGAFNQQLSGSVLKSLVNLTDRFAEWGQSVGQSKGFRAFVAYLKQVGPKVVTALGGIAAAFVAIVTAFAPVGTVVLTGLGQIGDAIANIPVGTLTALATAVVALVAGLKVASPIVELIGSVLAAPEVALAAIAVGAVAGGFYLLYKRSKPLQGVISDLYDFFKTQLFPIIKKAAEQIIPALNHAFDDISDAIKKNRKFIELFGKLFLTLTSAAVVAGILALAGYIVAVGKAISVGIKVAHVLFDVLLRGVSFGIRAFGLLLDSVLQTFGVILHAQVAAFGWIPGIGPKLKAASANFDAFASGIHNNLANAADNVDTFREKLDAIDKTKTIKIKLDDLEAVRSLEALQAFRLKDKTITVRVEQELDRAVGPGGGIGRPTGAAQSKPTKAPDVSGSNDRVSTSSQRSAPLVNVEHMETTGTDDILRKTGNVLRSRAGGGVIMAGSNS